jgi:N-acetylneuraminic acid mutarotase
MVNANGTLYLFGGRHQQDLKQLYNDIFKYDMATGMWHKLLTYGELPAAHDNKIYLCGG